MSLSSLKNRLEHHFFHFGVRELLWPVLGRLCQPVLPQCLTKLNFQLCQFFCHLGSVWCDSAGITGLSYHTEAWCNLWQLYEVCRIRVDRCSLGWRFTKLSCSSCCCTVVRLQGMQCWTGGRFVSWGISLEIAFIFCYSVILRWKNDKLINERDLHCADSPLLGDLRSSEALIRKGQLC